MPKRSVNYTKQMELRGDVGAVALPEAIGQVKKMAGIKADRGYKGGKKRSGFDQTIELAMHLGIDPKQADQALRGSFAFPKGIGKSKKVIAFCEGELVDKAKASGAIEAGVEELVDKINNGWMDFDVAIAHPSVMGKVGKLGRVLGPSGKMPSPKSGTVTADIELAIREFVAGKIEYRNDDGGNIHVPVGKASFSESDLRENIEAFIGHIQKIRPPTAKGQFIKRVSLTGTMTPSMTVDLG